MKRLALAGNTLVSVLALAWFVTLVWWAIAGVKP